MKFKIRHKTEGWTGTLEIEDYLYENWGSSHSCGGKIGYTIEQDTHKPDGTYVEDPEVLSLDELEFLTAESQEEIWKG